VRLIVFSDLHLDTAFAWARPEVARARRQAVRDTLVRIVGLAEEVGADAILCAGDLYEHDRSTPDTAEFLRATFGATDLPVHLAPGNHDWHGPASLYAQVAWPSNVTVFTETELTAHSLDDGLTLWGAAHRAPANTPGFLDGGFRVDRDGVHLALFHGSERSGFPLQEEGKRLHAPFDADQIAAAGIHHAFVGHYHRPSDAALHTYPGNPDPLTFGEDGERGAVVATVADDGTVTRERHRVACSEVHDVAVDVTGLESRQGIRDRVSAKVAGLSGCARITLTGEVDPSVDLDLADLGSVPSGLDQVVVRARDLHVGYRLDEIGAEESIRGRFVRDVLAAEDLSEDDKQRIVATGLRALDGRPDLEVA
jgi:DNA repair protein SbcD/Mre11